MKGWFVILIVLIAACSTNSSLKNKSPRYVSSAHPIRNAFKVYHRSEDSSDLHFQLLSSDLLYTRSDQSSPFVAKYDIHYQIIDATTGVMLDSSTKHFKDIRVSDDTNILQGMISIPFAQNHSAKLKLIVRDRNRNAYAEVEQNVDKQTEFHGQYFMLIEDSSRTILGNIIKTDLPFVIRSDRYHNDKIFMKYYGIADQLPPPPFSSSKNTIRIPHPDTILTKDFGGSLEMSLDKKGIYHFTNDTLSGKGFTLLRFSNEYPKVTTNEMLYEPLRYLTSTSEYEKIVNAEDAKLAVDQFWIKLGGSKDIARKLIRAFYGRVENANTYFSTYVEGWRTDRGLIYIIFGPPEEVIELSGRELWQYGNESVSTSLSFTFRNVDNELSENVFELERSVNYKSHWYRALDTWRSGRIYTAR